MRIGVEDEVVTLAGADDHVAALGEQRVAREAGSLREPRILDRDAELVAEDVGDLVLEALLLLVGEGKVRRVGAHAQDLAVDEIGAMAFDGQGRDRQHAEEEARPPRAAPTCDVKR